MLSIVDETFCLTASYDEPPPLDPLYAFDECSPVDLRERDPKAPTLPHRKYLRERPLGRSQETPATNPPNNALERQPSASVTNDPNAETSTRNTDRMTTTGQQQSSSTITPRYVIILLHSIYSTVDKLYYITIACVFHCLSLSLVVSLCLIP